MVILLILFLTLSPSNCVLSQHVYEPVLPHQIRWIDMKAFENFALNITPLEEVSVSSPNICSVLCMADIKCKSINVIFKVSELICQLLYQRINLDRFCIYPTTPMPFITP